MLYENKNFENETVSLDGNTFKDCMFRKCVLQIGGTAHFTIHDTCTLHDTAVEFIGAAKLTADTLRSFYHSGQFGRRFVEWVIREIENGPRPG